MEEENKKPAWKIWLYLTPVYILVAIPLLKWTMKINSSDVNLSKDTYNAFNSDEGEVKKTAAGGYEPDLNDSGYALHYRSAKAGAPKSLDEVDPERGGGGQQASGGQQARGEEREPAPRQGQAAQQRAAAVPAQAVVGDAKQQFSLGQQKGVMTYAVGKAMGNPKAVGAIFNNSYVVNGFMGRGTVKSALGSSQGLMNYLKNGNAVNNFLGNSVVQAALNNPAVVNAFASSSMASSILASPGVQGLLANPDAISSLAASNPQMLNLLSNPNVMNALMNNPETAGVAASLGGAVGGMNYPKK